MRQYPLHKQDVYTGLEQTGCESSAEIVLAQLLNPSGMSPPSDDASDRLCGEALSEKSSRAMNRKEQSARRRAPCLKSGSEGGCRSLPQKRRSTMFVFAKYHRPASVYVGHVEMRQLGTTESGTVENRKNCKITAPTKGLVIPRDRKKPFDTAGVDRLSWALAVAADVGKITGTVEILIGHLSQAPSFAQHSPQRGDGEFCSCGSISGDQLPAEGDRSAIVEKRPGKVFRSR